MYTFVVYILYIFIIKIYNYKKTLHISNKIGSTPAKKDFRYSKKLVKTSPHERLLKRYRETLKDIDTENEVSWDV